MAEANVGFLPPAPGQPPRANGNAVRIAAKCLPPKTRGSLDPDLLDWTLVEKKMGKRKRAFVAAAAAGTSAQEHLVILSPPNLAMLPSPSLVHLSVVLTLCLHAHCVFRTQ